jgi:GDP-4-dehydro-6-deoxy-D-mannose reductase
VAARTAGTTEIAVGNLTARRDFTDVRDVVRAYRLVAERGVPGAIYNVCSGRDVVLSDVAARLRTLAYPDARFVEDESLMRPVEIPALRGDPSQLREATTWTQEIDLNTTLRDVVADAEARATDTGT